MLLNVEGGGFFSASASGYSKFLSLLFIGRQDEGRQMNVLPWSQYQLVEQETDLDFQLASRKKRPSHRCPFFICFRCPSTDLDRKSPPKVGPAQSESLLDPSIPEKCIDSSTSDENEENATKILLKSSLKKHPTMCTIIGEDEDAEGEDGDAEEAPDGLSDMSGNTGKRKIQWTDACGRELVEIREFEPSEIGASEAEIERDDYRRCECTIQ